MIVALAALILLLVLMPSPDDRAKQELGYLIAVGALTGLGFASVYIARQAVIGWGSLTYAGVLHGALSGRPHRGPDHGAQRRPVPAADDGFLTAVGLTEIYRLGPTTRSSRASGW